MASVMNFDSFSDISKDYDPEKNRSINIMSCYEKTNVIGFRLEQLAFGAQPILNKTDLLKCKTIREVANLELKLNLLPFIICRTVNNTKEYWKLKDLLILH